MHRLLAHHARRQERGFTLIELLVVMLIIGVLAAIAVPIFMNQQAESRRTAVRSDVRSAVAGVTTYLVADPDATDLSQADIGRVVSDTNMVTVSGTADAYIVRGTTTADEDFEWCYDSATGQSGEQVCFTPTYTPQPPSQGPAECFTEFDSAYGQGYDFYTWIGGGPFNGTIGEFYSFGDACLSEYERGHTDRHNGTGYTP